jgi:imidazolonepropionase-like amidohydrolase
MRAGIAEAHKASRKVATHAYSAEAINECFGCRGRFHRARQLHRSGNSRANAGARNLPRAHHVGVRGDEREGPELGAPEYIQGKTAEVLEASRGAFRLALGAGVLVAASTNCGPPGHPHGTLPEELRLMVEAGAIPPEALRHATSAAADLFGLGGEVGTLE